MDFITKTRDLSAFCKTIAQKPYITIDTEFLRDKTYYPRLCLIQIAADDVDAVAIDPLADGMDISCLNKILQDENIVKVFHACRQDLEIFYNLNGVLPTPVFDTQVAAMVCGFGDQIGYHGLVSDICGKNLDKGPQFTDWSRRPLSKSQLSYALDDVIYLRDVYKALVKRLNDTGRATWLDEETGRLLDPATYNVQPDDVWKKIKIKSSKPRTFEVLKAVAAWRERRAQDRDVPKNRIMRDETLADIAIHPPQDVKAFSKIRNMPHDIAKSPKIAAELLDVIQSVFDHDADKEIVPDRKERFPAEATATLEMLKMLLRIVSGEKGVAAKLIASQSDLQDLALDDSADIPALNGWRYDIFGKEAIALKQGKIGLSLENGEIVKREL